MTVLLDAVRPRTARSKLAFNIVFPILGSFLVAGLAQISIHLPFTPVPITGQTLGVLLVGASLGSVRGGASILLYLGEGAAGMPVFADGQAGPHVLALGSPTGGYLWGFVAAAFIVGLLSERRWDRGLGSAIGAMLVGEIVIYLVGVPWLAHAIHKSQEQARVLGLYPFVVGDTLKLLIAAGALPAAWRFVRSHD